MNYLFNDRNLLRGAILSALNIVASTSIFRTDNDAKAGSGTVTLSGPYTGQHDTEIEIEILDGSGDSSQVSQPVFRGVGNGTISNVSVTALAAQDFSVVVSDLGTQTLKAIAPFQGATLRALLPGQNGNLISISVDPSAIVRTPIDRALQGNISAGTNTYTGTQWDFGALALDAAGNIPEAAPRLSFGDDPQVYVAFKSYDFNAQQWTFGFSPPPVRDVPQGAIVKAVTGTWGMTISDGTTTENYTGIVTLRDALTDIQSLPSALCEVVTPITNNHQPGGMAAMDVSVWTRPLVLSVSEDGSFAVKAAVINFTVDSTAPTESIVIRCSDASAIGAEIWTVTGDITTGLPNAVTGVPYAEGPYTFTIPVNIPDGTAPAGDIGVQWNPLPRGDDEQEPVLCVKRAVLGAQAHNASYTFTYKKKPPDACVCIDDIHDSINWACLGIDPPTGGGEPVAETSILVRRRTLAASYNTFVQANTDPPVSVDTGDVTWAIKGYGIFADLLNLLSSSAATLSYPARQSTHDYAQDDQIEVPISAVQYRFTASVPGTSAGSAPDFSGASAIGAVVIDGGVTWTNIGKAVLLMYDDAFNAFDSDATDLAGVEATQDLPTWKPDTFYSGAHKVVPTVPNGFYYQADSDTNGKTSGPLEPIWPTTADVTVIDPLAAPPDGIDPITWTCKAFTDETASAATDDLFFERYRAPLREVSLAAGIVPNFDDAGASGTPCWRDFQDNNSWFVNTDGPLKPLQLGHTYHSCKDSLDEDGKPIIVPTYEFALQLLWGCPDKLKTGDSFTVTIGVAGGSGAYQEGDTITVVVAHQDPVPFGGGQLGNDMTTFGVHGTSDGDFPPYHLIAASPAARINSHSYLLGDLYAPATPNGRFYECTQAGTSAGSPPTFTTDRSEFTDGGAKFQDMGLIAGYDEGGLAMTIAQGGIPFALADEFDFSAIGGHYQWRQDGGSWNGPIVIGSASIPLPAGLVANFTGGAAPPSWSAGDIWAFLAQAVNGPDEIQSPTGGRLVWTTSTTIGVTPADNGPASRVAIFDHNIPDDAGIVLEGSDDDFGTTPTSVTLTWQARNIFATFATATRAKWRIRIDKGGDCFWVFLGQQMQPMLRDPGTGNLKPDYGHFTRRRRAAGLGIRAGVGGDILHDVVCADSLDDFEAGFDWACANDNKAFGIVINDDAGEVALVRFTGADIETKEVLFDYQASRDDRYQSFTVPTEALP